MVSVKLRRGLFGLGSTLVCVLVVLLVTLAGSGNAKGEDLCRCNPAAASACDREGDTRDERHPDHEAVAIRDRAAGAGPQDRVHRSEPPVPESKPAVRCGDTTQRP